MKLGLVAALGRFALVAAGGAAQLVEAGLPTAIAPHVVAPAHLAAAPPAGGPLAGEARGSSTPAWYELTVDARAFQLAPSR